MLESVRDYSWARKQAIDQPQLGDTARNRRRI